MEKFSFKMKDRMKIVVEKNSPNSCSLTVSGKSSITFSFSKKRAAELVQKMQSVITYGVGDKFVFRKTLKSPAGSFDLSQPTTCVDSYYLVIFEGDRKIFCEGGLTKKSVKKMIKVMKEVFGVE